MSHTPGPWSYEFAPGGGYDCMTDAFHVSLPGHLFVCEVDLANFGQSASGRTQPTSTQLAEAEANARLIAAAPELLAALRAVLAVASANCEDPEDPQSIDPSCEAARRAIAKAEGR